METTKTINRAIRILIANKGERQSATARAIGMEKTLFSRRMSGTTPWKVAELEALAAHFDVSITVFFDEEVLALNLTDLRKAGASWSDARIAVEQALPAAA